MKKIFTMLSTLLLAGSLAAQTQEVECYVQYWDNAADDYVYGKSYTAELIKNEDGSYTVTNILNSGGTASFTFENAAVGDSSPIKMVGNVKKGTYGWYLLSESGKNLKGSFYKENATEATTMNSLYVYDVYEGEAYSYVEHLDTTSEDVYNEYCAAFSITDAPDYNEDVFVWFYFNDPEGTTKVDIIDNDSNEPIEYFNLQGMKVENPENGIFIRRQGKTTQKVIFK